MPVLRKGLVVAQSVGRKFRANFQAFVADSLFEKLWISLQVDMKVGL